MAKRLTQWLKDLDFDATFVRHPGATPLGAELRKLIANPEMSVDAQTRALLLASDNAAFISSVLRPSLERNKWLISDRNNFITSIPYQVADGVDPAHLDKIHAATYPLDQFPKIDLLLIMRVSYETACSRRQVRTTHERAETFEKKMTDRSFFDRVANAYDKLMEDHSERLLKFIRPADGGIAPEGTPRCLYIDANQSEDAVFSGIIEAVLPMTQQTVQQ
jgi:thymidylate kinase